MFNQFTDRARKSLALARDHALAMGQDYIGTEHLLVGLLKEGTCTASKVLKTLGFDLDTVRRAIESKSKPSASNTMLVGELPMTPRLRKVLEASIKEARSFNSSFVGSEHLLLGIVNVQEGVAYQVLSDMGADKEKVRNEVNKALELGSTVPDEDILHDPKKRSGKTPALDAFGNDLVERAFQKKLDPMIGREVEVKRLMTTLVRRRKNNPVLLGEPGVGKTAIVEGLAQLIVAKEVPDLLISKRIVELDLALVVAGTKYRGQFEERIKAIIDEVSKNKDIILFIDEIHIMVGAGNAEGAMDASNILKPALSRGQVQCIGATTLAEYRKFIEKDGALERRFQPIIVSEPTKEQSVEILKGLRRHYASHHGVSIDDEALVEAVNMSDRYITERKLPDKAIDVIDEAGAMIKLERHSYPPEIRETEKLLADLEKDKEQAIAGSKFEIAAELRDKSGQLHTKIFEAKRAYLERQLGDTPSLSVKDVRAVISSMTGIPVMEMSGEESKKLLSMESEIHKTIVSQDDAVSSVCRAIRRSKAGFKDPNRPVATMLFLGPTGVGKTLLAKCVAKFIFGEKGSFFQFDMSEYMEQHAVSKLIGAPPGYIGYEEGGQLTEKVRKHPYCVILFDEIEKAHHDIFNALLQLMEEGRLTDGIGRTVDFKNAIIFMTSNVGASSIKDQGGMGFGKKDELDRDNIKAKIKQDVEHTFRPEFINRIDDLVFFNHLSKEELCRIVEMEVAKLSARILEKGVVVSVTDNAKTFILEKGYSKEYGARPLRRAVEQYVEDPLGDKVLSGEVEASPGTSVVVGHEDDKDALSFVVTRDAITKVQKKKRTVAKVDVLRP